MRPDATPEVKKAQDEALNDAKAAEGKSAEIQGAGMSDGEKFAANMPVSVLGGENKKPIIQVTTVYGVHE